MKEKNGGHKSVQPSPTWWYRSPSENSATKFNKTTEDWGALFHVAMTPGPLRVALFGGKYLLQCYF